MQTITKLKEAKGLKDYQSLAKNVIDSQLMRMFPLHMALILPY